jgi:Mrp family chromosome partitioning ATPase
MSNLQKIIFPQGKDFVKSRGGRFGGFSPAHRKVTRILRTFKRLGDPKSAQALRDTRDKIYYDALKSKKDESSGTAIALSGAVGQEGTTTISLLLALALGELRHSRILYVNGGFENQDLAVYQDLFGLSRISDFCNGFSRLQWFESKNQRLFFLSGATGVDPIDFFSHPELDEFLAELKSSFDYIFFDMPPLSTASETRLLVPKMDLFYLVCVPRKTLIADIEECKRRADDIGGTISGTILNRQKVPWWARFFGRDAFV